MNSQIRALPTTELNHASVAYVATQDHLSDETINSIHTVGDVVRYIECNRQRATEMSLADCAKNYWLRPVRAY